MSRHGWSRPVVFAALAGLSGCAVLPWRNGDAPPADVRPAPEAKAESAAAKPKDAAPKGQVVQVMSQDPAEPTPLPLPRPVTPPADAGPILPIPSVTPPPPPPPAADAPYLLANP